MNINEGKGLRIVAITVHRRTYGTKEKNTKVHV